jgi:hypothetical protein
MPEKYTGDFALTFDDAARILKVCKKTIQREVAAGRIIAFRYSDRCVRILSSEMQRYLQSPRDARRVREIAAAEVLDELGIKHDAA